MNTQSPTKFVRTRIAPTPSGYLHLGNVVSFVVTAGLARKYGARIFLRIDDLDQERVRKEYLQDIFDTLGFLGLPWDEGPRDMLEFERSFSQVHRLPLYQEALRHLEKTGAVFACSCSRSQLTADGAGIPYPGTCIPRKIPLAEPGVSWRLLTDPGTVLHARDLVDGLQYRQLPESMRFFQVRKKDGSPAYQLASVVDDLHYGVDLVVRGADLFDSTLAQLYLSLKMPANHFTDTVFFHHSLVQDSHGRKLSKSAGDTSIKYFREKGMQPADVFSAISTALDIPSPTVSWEDLFLRLFERWSIRLPE